jgi:7-carboxy-7-deazaguanine synthase
VIVNEIFYSLQGEGFLAGIPSVFIRLAGCPLRCRWCDTKYALSETAGEDYDIMVIVEKIRQQSCQYVVITGGEPMVNSKLPGLVQQLKALNKHITIETAGISYVPGLACDLMSISPKFSNSMLHEDSRLNTAVLRELIDNYPYQLKFVVDRQEDIEEIQQAIKETGNIEPGKVMLMPQATSRQELAAKSQMVARLCKQTGYAFCQRLQILLWDNKRGT